jgi:4-amino-4-deoxy-L-arabinose transferase-like glycosyltransferase
LALPLELPLIQPEAIGRRDLVPGIVVLMSLAAGLAASWERWGNPLIDSGREMDVPLRLTHGEMLYSQVRYIYGPLSPYVNAWLYRALHPSLWVLWGRGIVVTAIILALTYWLARQIAGRGVAAFSCLFVTWVCALKPQGNYILPYAYSALDGAALGLGTTALLILWAKRRDTGSSGARTALLVLAGICAGLAALAKTEMGIATTGTGLIAVALAEFPKSRRILGGWIAFLLPALGLPAAVYAWFASRVGWHTLTTDSFLFFGHVPWQLIYFNKLRFGLDRPWYSMWLMAASLARLAAIAGVIAGISLYAAKRRGGASVEGAGRWPRRHPGWLTGVSIGFIVLTSFGLGDLGPFLPMPFLLLGLIAAALASYWKEWRREGRPRRFTLVFLVLATFAFGSIGRILFRVSTGGALSSDLLPAAVVLFVYIWMEIVPGLLPERTARETAARAVAAVLVVALVATAATLSARYRKKFTYPIVTPRGTMYAAPDLGVGFSQAMQFVEANTQPGDWLAVMPEGTSLDFFTGRRNPLRDDITVPGMLDQAGELRAIADIERTQTPIVMIANRSTHEFGQAAFGIDYDRRLMKWIETNYRVCGIFGPVHDDRLQVGSPVFFIRAYCRVDGAQKPQN